MSRPLPPTLRVCGYLALILWSGGAPSAAVIKVGPEREHQTLSAGVAAADAGDRVVLDPGVYVDDVAIIDKPLVIEGAGRGVVLRVTTPVANRKGILVVNADLTVRNVTFESAKVAVADGQNGAGIRHQAGRLVVDTCTFMNNQNGILANGNRSASVIVRRSSFVGNGAGDGYTHGIYVNAIAELDVSDSTFSGTNVGHNIKSRALRTVVTDTVLDDGVSGTPSYAIDLPNGGDVALTRLRIVQGPQTRNPSMIAYGAEGNLHRVNTLRVADSVFINRARGAVAINNFSTVTATLRDNVFQDVGQITKGLVKMSEDAIRLDSYQ